MYLVVDCWLIQQHQKLNEMETEAQETLEMHLEGKDICYCKNNLLKQYSYPSRPSTGNQCVIANPVSWSRRRSSGLKFSLNIVHNHSYMQQKL